MHGEIGQTQFLPKTILNYGTGGSLDTAANALASTANLLRAHGWQAGAGYPPGETNFGAVQASNTTGISGPSRSLANRLTEERAPLGGAEGVASEIRLVAHPRLSTTQGQLVNDPSMNPAAVFDPRLERSRVHRKIAAAGTVRGCCIAPQACHAARARRTPPARMSATRSSAAVVNSPIRQIWIQLRHLR
jgi:hypothetical protein